MKKSLFIAVLLISTLTMNAREYQHSVGIVAGNSFGLSYKGYIRGSEHLVIETNLMTTLLAPGSWSERFLAVVDNPNTKQKGATDWVSVPADKCNFLTFVANPNFYYQAQAADLPGAVLNWYAGGGIGVGALWLASNDFKQIEGFGDLDGKAAQTPALKIDEHAVVGLEFCFKNAPLNLSIDFRPGLGEFMYISSASLSNTTMVGGLDGLFFDWTAGIALRYRIGK